MDQSDGENSCLVLRNYLRNQDMLAARSLTGWLAMNHPYTGEYLTARWHAVQFLRRPNEASINETSPR